jgi:curli biogenesis system outer membrane secretion channel CsgG
VQSGEVLLTVNTQKTVYSYGAQVASLKFINGNQDALEAEIGIAANEPVTFAVKTAIEGAVLDLVKEGEHMKLWQFKTPPPQTTTGVSITSPTSSKKIPTVWY